MRNIEKRREQQRLYRIKNKEKIRLQRKEYRELHKEEIRLWGKKYRLENKDKIRQIHKKYYDKNQSKILEYLDKNKIKIRLRNRKYRVKKDYDISWERFIEMYEAQWGMCAICGVYKKHPDKENSIQSDVLHIDHCHNTKKVRGLLCTHCNKAIGVLREDVRILENAINYIKYFSDETTKSSSGCGKGNPCPVI